MVCTFGRGKMTCIARILDVGGFEGRSSEDARNERIAIQTIYRHLCDSDEPNLLEEKDMHVFDSKPLTDPLYLVRCNICDKPVKASHIAAHAECCRSINSKEGDALELDAGTERKIPSKKGRKKNQATNGRVKQKSEPAGRDNVASTELNLEYKNGMLQSASGEPRRMAVFNDHGTRTVALTVRRESTNYPDMTGPLATKIYYLHGSHHLQTALGHLYWQSSAKEHDNDSTFAGMNQDKTMLSSQEQNANKL